MVSLPMMTGTASVAWSGMETPMRPIATTALQVPTAETLRIAIELAFGPRLCKWIRRRMRRPGRRGKDPVARTGDAKDVNRERHPNSG